MINNNHFELEELEPELELRLTALVMGEASDLERDQLQSLIEERAEVAAWYRQLLRLHAALREIADLELGDFATSMSSDRPVNEVELSAADTSAPISDGIDNQDEWKLSSDRRQSLLAVLDGSVAAAQFKQDPASQDRSNVSRWPGRFVSRKHARWLLAAAASCGLLGLASWSLQLGNRREASTALAQRVGAAAAKARASRELAAQTSDVPSPYYLQDEVQYFPSSVAAAPEPQAAGATSNSPTVTYRNDSAGNGAAQPPPYVAPGMYGMTPFAPAEPASPTVAKVESSLGDAGMGMGGMGGMGMGGYGGQAVEGGYAMGMGGYVGGMGAMEGYDAGPEGNGVAGGMVGGGQAGQQVASSGPGGVWGGRGRYGEAPAYNQPSDAPMSADEELFGRTTQQELTWELEERGVARKREESIVDQEKADVFFSRGAHVATQPEDLGRELKMQRELHSNLFDAKDTLGRDVAESVSVPDGGTILLGGLRLSKQAAQGLSEMLADQERYSTFSLHVSDVSFKLAMEALARGEWPESSKIRIEEFVNAIDYQDPQATQQEQVACQLEQAIHPFLMQRNMLRISLRTAATGRAQAQPLRLTLLLDNSGSMERADRRQTVRRAFETLAQQLTANDHVTLISFASTPRLLAERVSGDKVAELVQVVESLPSEGGTNIEAALLLATEKALEQARLSGRRSSDNNSTVAAGLDRMVMMTDGAVNLGDSDPQRLSELVTRLRDAGIAFDAAGISARDLNDEVLEALTRQGDGRYYLLDSDESVRSGFAEQIAGALRPAAKNVKVQVEFNPQRVGRYKLLGFDKHLLKAEDFRNDQVDAAELAAAEAGVAVYHFEAKPDGSGDVGSVSVRYQDLSTGQMVERRWPIPYQPQAPRLDQADPRLQLAAIAALVAAKLRGDAVASGTDLRELASLLSGLPSRFSASRRVQELQRMIEVARQFGQSGGY